MFEVSEPRTRQYVVFKTTIHCPSSPYRPTFYLHHAHFGYAPSIFSHLTKTATTWSESGVGNRQTSSRTGNRGRGRINYKLRIANS